MNPIVPGVMESARLVDENTADANDRQTWAARTAVDDEMSQAQKTMHAPVIESRDGSRAGQRNFDLQQRSEQHSQAPSLGRQHSSHQAFSQDYSERAPNNRQRKGRNNHRRQTEDQQRQLHNTTDTSNNMEMARLASQSFVKQIAATLAVYKAKVAEDANQQ